MITFSFEYGVFIRPVEFHESQEKILARTNDYYPFIIRYSDRYRRQLSTRSIYLFTFLMDSLPVKDLKTLIIIFSGLNFSGWYLDSRELIIIATIIGLMTVLFPAGAKWIAIGWYKLTEMLGWINSRIILTVIFFLILTPIALLYRLFTKDTLNLKKPKSNSLFTNRDHLYEPDDFKNMW